MEFSNDQQQFKEVVTKFFRDQSSTDAVRALMDSATGFDPQVWQKLSEEIGITGLHIPERFGGFGFGMVELGITLEQMGRHLYCGPFFSSSVMAAFALLESGDENAQQQYLPGIADGSTIFSLLVDDLSDPHLWGRKLTFSDDTLNGRASIVLDAGIADHLLVIAGDTKIIEEKNLQLFALPRESEGVLIHPLEVIDPTRKLYSASFTNARAERIGPISPSAKEKIWDRWCLCLSQEMLGGAQYLLDSTVEYTKLRYQFGRPIGSFQGLKHRCAELLMELELAKGVVTEATFALAGGDEETYLPSMAKAMASDVYISLAKAAIQLRGGIGFTWENDTHLWFKRAKSSEMFLGSPQFHRERMIRSMEGAGHAA